MLKVICLQLLLKILALDVHYYYQFSTQWQTCNSFIISFMDMTPFKVQMTPKNICSLNNGYTNIIILHLLKSLSICVNVVILVCNRVILVFRFPWHRIFKFCVDISNRFVPTWLIYYDVRVIFIFSRKIVSRM